MGNFVLMSVRVENRLVFNVQKAKNTCKYAAKYPSTGSQSCHVLESKLSWTRHFEDAFPLYK